MKKYTLTLIFITFSTALLTLVGCKTEDPYIEQLRKENPFAVPETPKPDAKTMVTCNTIKLTVPESYNISNLDIFKSYSYEQILADKQNPVLNGFGSEQFEVWKKNGFRIAIAPSSYWKSTIESLKRFMADDGPTSKLFIYNRLSDFSELTLNVHSLAKEIVLFSHSGEKGALTVGNGEFVFRFQSTITGPEQISGNSVNFFLISAYKRYLPLGTTQNILPEQLTGLDPLVLQGVLKNDNIIVITCDDSAKENDSIAVNMLYNKETRNISIIMLAPSAKMVTDISELSID